MKKKKGVLAARGSKGRLKDSLRRKERRVLGRDDENLNRVGEKMIFWTCQNEEEEVTN